jgi:penicillin amidase
LIEEKGILSVEDVKRMHMDQVSLLARETMRHVGNIESDDPELTPIFRMFQNWDGLLSTVSPEPAIYEVFTRYLIVKLTTPKLGDLAPRYAGKGPTPVLAEGSIFGEHSQEWLLVTLADPDSSWWNTGDGRSRSGLIQDAMRETLAHLRKVCGPQMEDWTWGKFHGLTFGHTLGGVKPLDRIFNRGPYPIGGDGNTIWASGSNVMNPNDHRIIGPPFRFIADLSDWNKSLGMLVPGQSGHPASEHYDDNIEGFFKGDYHPMVFDREQVMEQVKSRLTLEPQ